MSLFKSTVLGLTMAAGLALPALAQAAGDYQLVIIKNGGVLTRTIVQKELYEEMMKHATAVPEAMVLEHEGKAYMVTDYKMTAGPSPGTMASAYYSPENIHNAFVKENPGAGR